MVSLQTPIGNIGWKALDFNLQGVDGQYYNLAKARGPRGLLIMFICNHCPYVKAVRSRIVRDAQELMQHGISSIAIMPNDYHQYPEDSFENMKQVTAECGFPFPYVLDETQQVAKAYGAVCTPDFFGFNADLELHYRGRLDVSRKETTPEAKRDLFEAMCQVAATGQGPAEQVPSIGCSIKWRTDS